MDQDGSPAVGVTQGKVWGVTRLVFAWNGASAHLIKAVAGGYCSRHVHRSKWNRFVVVSGRLLVRQFPDDGCVDTTILGPGDVTDVPPGVRHEFEAIEDTVAMEFYWTVLDEGDICRENVGGLRNPVGDSAGLSKPKGEFLCG